MDSIKRDIVNDVNILGVILDSKFNFKIYILELFRKVYVMVVGLWWIGRFLVIDMVIML